MAERRVPRHQASSSTSDTVEPQEVLVSPIPLSKESPRVGDLEMGELRIRTSWDRFLGKGRNKVGVIQSFKNIYGCSWINVLLLVTPVAWWSHFDRRFDDTLIFGLCFTSIVPQACLFDYCGDQMALYCGKDFGDLISITLNNAVEVTLAIMLLVKCELKLLQSTITGVILLHLLLIPGAAFLTEGARIWEQDLHPVHTHLNHTLLTIGVLALLLPAAFYAAISDTSSTTLTDGNLQNLGNSTQVDFLRMSRGLALMLLLIYIASRIFYHNPPGGKGMLNHIKTPEQLKRMEEELQREEPEVNQWVCICFLIVHIGVMAATSEWLVDSIEPVKTMTGITPEFFGMVLLPIVSFSADGAVAASYYLQKAVHRLLSKSKQIDPPSTLAKAEAIDLSIQFVLLWMPVVTLLGWWTDKPFNLLFDLFEVALLLGACFLVNFVTADSKTNWAEGFMLLSFYAMMVLCTWYYTGQTSVANLLLCAGESAEVN